MRATITLDERHQEEPTTTGKETKQEPTVALVPLMEPIIEGEVIGVLEPEQQPTPKQRPYYLLVVGTVLACLLFTGASLIAPLFSPSATVTIIPREERLSTIGTIPIQGRVLPALTLSQSTTVPATGKRHQTARRAQGTITFYNGLFTSQTIGAGTILTGADGVQIVTDEPAIIPAGNPPIYGQVTISAHARTAGEQGNIQAFDINQACCLTSVLAKNATAFTGGAAARDFLVVTQKDINAAAEAIKATLGKSESAALTAQVSAGENLAPPLCSETVTSDHQAGEEARAVTVTLSESCSGLAYNTNAIHLHATQMLASAALQRLGTGYSLLGDVSASVIHTTISDQAKGIATLTLKLDATYVYQLSPVERKHITHLIAGQSEQQAVKALFQVPGIQAASINSNGSTLPNDPGRITIVVVYRSV